MVEKKYPIGTKIRYKRLDGFLSERLYGMTGKIVGIVGNFPLIYLPTANFVSAYSTKECPVTVQTSWDSLEILLQKNEQLLFSFME